MAAAARVFDLAIRMAVAGSLVAPTVRLGAEDIGLYSGISAGSETIGLSLAGIQGPTFVRNGAAVDATFPGAVVITGNLTVNGTTSTVNSTTVDVADRVIRVNKSSGADDPAPTNITGIAVYRGAVASVARDHYGLYWDESATEWKLAVNTGGDDATLGAYLNLHVLGITAASITMSGLTAGRVTYAGSAGLLVDDSAFLRSSLVFSVDPDADAVATLSRARIGTASGGTTDRAYFGHFDHFTSTNYALSHSSSGGTAVNAATGAAVGIRINNTEYVNVSASGFAVSTIAASFTAGLTASTVTNSSLTSGRVTYATTGGLQADDSGFTRASLALTVDANTDNAFTTGYGKMGLATSGTSTTFYIAQASNFTLTDAIIAQNSAGDSIFNAKTGRTASIRTNNTARLSVTNTSATFAAGVPVTFNDSPTITVDDAITNTTTDMLTLNHTSTGTVANNFGTNIRFNLEDDGGTNRTAAFIVARWSIAASATRTSSLLFQTVNSAGSATTGLALGGASATFSSGFPVAVNDSTPCTATGTGALIIVGGVSAAAMSFFNTGLLFGNASAVYDTARTNPVVYGTSNSGGAYPFTESGNLIISPRISGATRDVIISTTGTAADFRFDRNGTLQVSRAQSAGTVPAIITNPTLTITGGITDGMIGAIRLTPTYDAATAITVTRHNYIDVNNVAVTGVGPAAVTNACVFRFDAAAGTHKAVDAATTKSTPTAVDAWIKHNINGTIFYFAGYLSKTA
jgi:hypothetical protein